MVYLSVLTTEIASMPSGIESRSRSPFLTRWEQERLIREAKETNPRKEPIKMPTIRIVGVNQREPMVEANTMNIRPQLTE